MFKIGEFSKIIKVSIRLNISIGTKSTEIGYINRNNQQNKGRSEKWGTDHMQWFYHMECLNCGHKYYANGSEIWQRKCPTCQGGKA